MHPKYFTSPFTQGSPLSPVLFLIFTARICKKASTLVASLPLPIAFRPSLLRHCKHHPPASDITFHLDLHSYVDHVNPFLITRNTYGSQHQLIIDTIDDIIQQTAEADGLSWDHSKDNTLTFSSNKRRHPPNANHLGLIIMEDLDFKGHIQERYNKAVSLAVVMQRLASSNGGMSPAALHTLYTSSIRPILTYGGRYTTATTTPTS